jgi:hypothetical protein
MLPSKSNYYADAEPSEPSGPTEQEAAPEQEEKGESQTAEIPKSALGGKEFKPGEEVVMQVLKVLEDSVLVKYASGEKEEQEAPPPEAAQAPPPQGGPMSSMLS